MSAEAYRKATQTEVELPSAPGIKVRVRPQTMLDLLSLGSIPQAYLEGAGEVPREFHAKLTRHMLLRCVTGGDIHIVEECKGEQDVHVDELAQADVDAILSAVNKLTGGTGATFPVASEGQGDEKPAE